MSTEGKHFYEFGPFRFDTRACLLWLDGKLVALEPRVAETLLVLLQAKGELVPKKELMGQIWGSVAVTEHSLTHNISALRKALAQGMNGVECIKTVATKGYRFSLPITERQLEAQPPSIAKTHVPISVSDKITATEAVEVFGENEIEMDCASSSEAAEASASRAEIPLASAADSHLNQSETLQARQSRTPFAVHFRTSHVLSGVVVLLGLTIGFANLLLPSPQLRVTGYHRLTNDGQAKLTAPLTDGARIYFAEKGPNGTSLFAVAVAGGGTASVSLPMHDAGIFDLSPSRSELLLGRFISAHEGDALWVVPLLGGSPRRIGELRVTGGAVWSPDGQLIAYALHKRLYVANADGSAAREIAESPDNISWPTWSPDGKRLSFTAGAYRNGDVWRSIWEVGADGQNLHQILGGWNYPPQECCGTWTPDGRFFIFQSTRDGRTDLWALSEQRSFFRRGLGLPVRLSYGPEDYSLPIVSNDGKQIFTVGTRRRGELVRYDLKLQEFVPFLGGISATWVSFSKSGRSVAYINYPDLTLWRAMRDGSEKTQVTFSPLQVDGFSWSPDEKWFALRARYPGKNWMVYVVSTDDGDAKPLIPADKEQGVPSWSADGRSIAFGDVPPEYGKASGTEVIHIVDVTTHELSELPGSRGLWSARWSPDGKFLAALTISGRQLMIFDSITQKWRLTKAKGVNNQTWSNDCKYIYFDTDGDDRALRRASVADGHVEQLTSLNTYPNLAWWWSGVTPDNSPMILRDLGTSEIYSLTLESR